MAWLSSTQVGGTGQAGGDHAHAADRAAEFVDAEGRAISHGGDLVGGLIMRDAMIGRDRLGEGIVLGIDPSAREHRHTAREGHVARPHGHQHLRRAVGQQRQRLGHGGFRRFHYCSHVDSLICQMRKLV